MYTEQKTMLCSVEIKMYQKRQETNPSKDFSVPVNPELLNLSRFGSE